MPQVLKGDSPEMAAPLKAYVFSVCPYIASKKQFGFGPTVHIAMKDKGQRYSRTEILQATCFKDYGENQREVFIVDPLDMANDLVNECQFDGVQQGVWASRTKEPADADIVAAEENQRKFYLHMIEMADADWAKKQDPTRISMHARIGARELNLKREWAKDITGLVPCKGCKELIAADTAKCGRCGAVLDWELAIALGLVTEDQFKFAQKRGLAPADEKAEPAKKVKTA